ncbi:protein-glutamate methylesterase/protein-glutamine glutaminase [Marasmitruncus massiliensis]|uniref:protein-glutamate methylesterase/protein-glutamine glutaminase n=1 Tax=Marasmitruncus massiliensis TaxID=1944642 RepID=UPI000C7DAC6C|nr:chemotaxis response regulator protein-glutamate methylesterase [Marasmitruncus massiliensis]
MKELSKIKVLIVDDSVVFRQMLERELTNDLNIEIVGTAVDADDAAEKIQSLHPDVVTLDVEMPHKSGTDFLKKLMFTNPLPVVVVSSLPSNALNALDAGALDFVKKPEVQSSADLNGFISELTIKIKIASAARIVNKHAACVHSADILSLKKQNDHPVIAIGASTGGTEAILSIIRDLPPTTPGVIIVQHMPPVFTNMYAQRLDKICRMNVREAKNNDRVVPGSVLIAAGEYHLRLAKDRKGYYVKSEQGAKVSGHCPSVDVMFESVAATAGKNAIGVILTGMGSDGASGLLKMKQAGAYTIGQDKESCVVYGMPMVAFNKGGVVRQLPLDKIAGEIIRYLNALK